jgi:hypothetical protein
MQAKTVPHVTYRVLVAATALSLAAAAIHALFIGEHWQEWWGYGLFFLLAAGAQAVYALMLLGLPQFSPVSNRRARFVLNAGMVGNLAIVLFYVVTRTVGIPFFGPDAGSLEPVSALSLLSTALELALVGCLAVLRWQLAGRADAI